MINGMTAGGISLSFVALLFGAATDTPPHPEMVEFWDYTIHAWPSLGFYITVKTAVTIIVTISGIAVSWAGYRLQARQAKEPKEAKPTKAP